MSQLNSSPESTSESDSSRSDRFMSLYDHMDELRLRLMHCLYVFLGGFGLTYWQSDLLLGVLKRPLFAVLPPSQQKLYFTSLFENFMTHLKIAGYGSLFLFSPYYFYELWAFVSPGLYQKERKLALPFVSAATLFFIAGASFAYFVIFPIGFKYFVTYGAPSDVPLLTIDSYYSTCLKLMALFGLAFELPVIICLLGYLGLIDAQLLRSQRRIAIMMITALAALFAPPDAVSMILLGGPLILLYEASIWVVQWIGIRRKEEESVASPLEGRSRT